MEKVKLRRIKYRDGDVFYVPLPKEGIVMLPTEENQGAYIPVQSDKVSIGQVILSDLFIYIVIYEGAFSVKDIDSFTFESFLKDAKVIFMTKIIDKALKRGWWPIVGNYPIRDTIPMQAYSGGPDVIDYKSNLNNTTGHFKTEPEISKKLIRYGHTPSTGIIEDIAAYYHGEISKLYNFSKEEAQEFMDKYIPREEGVVWKVFPEFYTNSWKENE